MRTGGVLTYGVAKGMLFDRLLFFKGRDTNVHYILSYAEPWIPTWITPNRLSWMRIWIIPIIYGAYLVHPVFALAIFALAAITDAFDGHLARVRNLRTAYGKRLDEVSDKVLSAGALALLLADNVIVFSESDPLFVAAAVIFVRECFITGLRQIYPERAAQVPSLGLAKAKTWVLLPALGLLMLGGVHSFTAAYLAYLGGGMLMLASIFAVVSGGQYYMHFLRRG